MPSTLYGINKNNELIAVKTYKNSFASCYPAWDYFENKYFGKEVTTMKPKCWDLNKGDMDSSSEYFTLLSTFDGYIFRRKHLEKMINLLQQQSSAIPNLTRLQMFKDALNEKNYDIFFITANSVGDYSDYIDYHWDEETMSELSLPTLTNDVWDIWEAYLQEENNP